ncbi:hypothetical protein JTB14_005682 [Gonioctena quinquepunctata]|nr:hypothetical protein JTB14_005682 [Gonioctena quinquepunctata]
MFIWVPSHVRINGNESADRAARQAADTENIDTNIFTPDDLKSFLKNRLDFLWHVECNLIGGKLKDVKPWKPPEKLSRREQVVITRLRIGHRRLTPYLLLGEEPPHCEMCNVQTSIPHIINDCPKFILEQLNLKNSLSSVMKNFQSNNPVRKGYRYFL